MSLLFYDDSSDEADFQEFPASDTTEATTATKSGTIDIKDTSQSTILNKSSRSTQAKVIGGITLPPPRKATPVIIPPDPIPIAPPSIARYVFDTKTEKETKVVIDSDVFKTANQDLAEKNYLVRDKSAYNGVGHDRSKSQLTYLAEVDIATRANFDQQVKKSTAGRAKAKMMYGW